MLVWISASTYPTTKDFVQTFFWEKVWIQNTLPTYGLDICPKFRSFFIWDSLLSQTKVQRPEIPVTNLIVSLFLKAPSLTLYIFRIKSLSLSLSRAAWAGM